MPVRIPISQGNARKIHRFYTAGEIEKIIGLSGNRLSGRANSLYGGMKDNYGWLKDLEAELEHLNSVELEELQNDIDQLKIDLDAAQQEIDELNNTTIPNLQDDITQNDQEIDNLYTQFDDINEVQVVDTFPSTATEGEIIYHTGDNKLYRYTGTEWSKDVTPDDIAGQFDDTHIADDAITTPKILSGAITTIKLDALAVTSAKIAADSIISSKIAAGEVDTIHLNADSVTTNKIAADAIIANHIGAGEIDALHIDTDAIRAHHILAGEITANKLNIGELNAITVNTGALTITGIINNSGDDYRLGPDGLMLKSGTSDQSRIQFMNSDYTTLLGYIRHIGNSTIDFNSAEYQFGSPNVAGSILDYDESNEYWDFGRPHKLHRTTNTNKPSLGSLDYGVVIWNTSDDQAEVWTGSAWVALH